MPSKFRWNLFEAISYKISPVHLVQDLFALDFVIAIFVKNAKNITCCGLILYILTKYWIDFIFKFLQKILIGMYVVKKISSDSFFFSLHEYFLQDVKV